MRVCECDTVCVCVCAQVVEVNAALKGLPVADVAAATRRNAIAALRLPALPTPVHPLPLGGRQFLGIEIGERGGGGGALRGATRGGGAGTPSGPAGGLGGGGSGVQEGRA